MSSRTSFIELHLLIRRRPAGQLLQRRERVALDELVDVREGRRHSAGQRRVAGRRPSAGSPTRPGARPGAGAPSARPSTLGVAAVPAVGEDHDDRAAGHAPHAPLVVERAQALAEPGAARPVGDRARPRAASAASGSRDDSSRVSRVSRVPRANASTRPRPTTAACRKRSSARAYGSIEPLTSSSSTSRRGPLGRLEERAVASARRRRAARAARCGAGRAGRAARPARPQPARPAQRAGEAQVGHQPARLGELGGGVGGEVLVAQHLGRAEAHRERRRRRSRVAVVVVGRRRRRRRSSSASVISASAGVGGAERRRTPLPERGERAVVGVDVLGAAHERGPARPVHARRGRRRPTRAERLGERDASLPTGTSSPAPRSTRANATGDAGRRRRRRRRQARARGTAARCTRSPSPCSRDALLVLAVLEDRAERGVDRRARRASARRARRAPAPSRSSRRRPAACRARARAAPRPRRRPGGPARSATSGARRRTIATSRSKSGCSTQW